MYGGVRSEQRIEEQDLRSEKLQCKSRSGALVCERGEDFRARELGSPGQKSSNLNLAESFAAGWLSSLSWLVGVASAMFIAGNLIPGLISLTYADYAPEPYQGYLFVIAIALTSFMVNTFLAKHLPLLEGFVLCFMRNFCQSRGENSETQ